MAPRDTHAADQGIDLDPAQVLATNMQCTLKEPISCSGVGLHSGKKISMTLLPAEPGTGILFRRTDIAGGGAEIPARWDSVVDTRLCTVIGDSDGNIVGTIEHLLAALAGAGVDNAVIELNGPEVPVMDGSAAPFVFLMECAGIVEQNQMQPRIEVLKPVSVAEAGKSATLMPSTGSSFSFEIDFATPVIGRQALYFDMKPGRFSAEIARARTFGFEKDVAQLRAMGLAKGGSLENAVVLGEDRVLNDDGLRFEDEFVRHKLLDSVGDLALAGAPIQGHFHGFKSGHALNNTLLRALFADNDAWRVVNAPEDFTDSFLDVTPEQAKSRRFAASA
jgi:UDP-3-O-[3-hydroxymyristoyl] N-acetylglucosamine deacetylase